jgi:hypothetical protein
LKYSIDYEVLIPETALLATKRIKDLGSASETEYIPIPLANN